MDLSWRAAPPLPAVGDACLEPRNSVAGLSPRVFDGLGTVGELRPSMTILDLDQLATVTGGRGGFAPRQQQQEQGAQQPQGDPAQGGNFLSGLDQFLSFFQSDSFQQILGGLRGIVGQFGGAQQQQPQQAQPQGDSAAQ
jgi:hypothetical protein